jgi:hypothetical protein
VLAMPLSCCILRNLDLAFMPFDLLMLCVQEPFTQQDLYWPGVDATPAFLLAVKNACNILLAMPQLLNNIACLRTAYVVQEPFTQQDLYWPGEAADAGVGLHPLQLLLIHMCMLSGVLLLCRSLSLSRTCTGLA